MGLSQVFSDALGQGVALGWDMLGDLIPIMSLSVGLNLFLALMVGVLGFWLGRLAGGGES